MRPTAPLLLAGGYALLLLSWAVANPPFAAPDEPAHYLRALAVGGGEFEGRSMVTVPAGLWAVNLPCNQLRPAVSAACLYRAQRVDQPTSQFSGAGTYPPLAYVAPGLAERAAHSPTTADRAGRLAAMATSFVFLLGALLLLWEPSVGALSLLGITVAVTPMVLFICSIVNSSGLETSAGLAFVAGLLRLSRPEHYARKWAWTAVAGAGATLALSRSTGILWLLLDVGIVTVTVGTRSAVDVVKSEKKSATTTLTVIALAVAANRLWEAVYGSDITREGPVATGWFGMLGNGFEQLPRLLTEWVGVFGWLDAHMPAPAYLAWQLMAAVVFGAAILVGRRCEILGLSSALVIAALVAALLSATLAAADAGGVQSRQLMPFLALTPLLAGEILMRNRVRAQGLNLPQMTRAVVVLAAATQLVAWYWNARRQAVGENGPLLFLSHPQWTPPFGWWTWACVALLGSLALVAGAQASRPESSS